ncbi:hypothetical protein OG568_12810 [Streptomyces sp. NBC_01450]|uniref:hypothetical protein n=1 Tax=Streptomyces sp. NBC_01450 TaxID=2903871 RepID=UPI002E374D9E|nr:hypothetical protein [Streptomyces sp. NBC_01450]
MLLEVTRGKISEVVRKSGCEAVRMVPRETLEAILDGLDESVPIGIGSAAMFRSTYHDRHDSIKEFREANFGWRQFFDALNEAKESVGILAARGNGWRMILLVNESADSVIACLVRPPSRADWPTEADKT